MGQKLITLIVLVCLFVTNSKSLSISLTISARTKRLEVQWKDANIRNGDTILITTEVPIFCQYGNDKVNSNLKIERDVEESQFNSDNNSTKSSGSPNIGQWLCNNSTKIVIYTINPRQSSNWITTTIPFDYSLSKKVTTETKCYGFWVSYVDSNETIQQTNCIRAYPKWMNEMRSHIETFRIRDLFIPGTHDSGSYRYRFDPLINETLVTKYSLTQDEDIRGQLMHGVRYLDIRVGYYRASSPQFWVNHGITKQRPLQEILEQVINFVEETSEIVVFDVQEFPVGFGRSLDIHRNLVNFMKTKLGDHLVDPSLSWQAKLKDIWQRKQNIILCYDNVAVVDEFPTILFPAVEQKWGDVQSLSDLESFLFKKNQLLSIGSRPVANMAELTPDTWGVLTDRYGGLRRMADYVNRHVSKWYEGDLGISANIVAVDFYRGTTITETAILWNMKRILT